MPATANLTIERWRSGTPPRQPVVAWLAAEALAAEVAESLPALPPQALLLVRRVALALPGLDVDRIPDARLRQLTGQASRRMLTAARDQAARPARQAADNHAVAVFFADEAELLACLARDALDGRLDTWWWRSVLGRHYPDWTSAWQERPTAGTAALRLLTRAGLDEAVADALGLALPPTVARPSPAPVLHAAQPPASTADLVVMPPAAPPATTAGGRPAIVVTDRGTDAGSSSDPPLAARVPPAAATSGDATQAATVARPASARPAGDLPPTPGEPTAATPPRTAASEAAGVAAFAGRAAGHTRTSAMLSNTAVADASLQRPASPATDTARRPAVSDSAVREDEATAPPAARGPWPPPASHRAIMSAPVPAAAPPIALAPRTTAGKMVAAPGDTRQTSAGPPAVAAAVRSSVLPPALPGHATTPTARRGSDVPAPTEQAPAQTVAMANDLTPAGEAWPLAVTPQAVFTRCARLLFLVNLLLGDGLYPDFTRPAERGFPVPLWQLLALLGIALAGPEFRRDPLHAALETLASEVAGNDQTDLDRRWPIPAAPGGQRLRARSLRRQPKAAFARWFVRYCLSLRRRLAAALAVAPALVGRQLWQQHGDACVWLSTAEIVVVYPLDEHPVAWRLAGLDRDPGYLPSVGRTLRFVFE
jgi:hypothetical protein